MGQSTPAAERAKARRRNRTHIKRSSESDVTAEYELALRAKARRCPMPGCGVKLTGKPWLPNSKELDHIIPIGVGGTHSVGNVRIICRQCNQRRPKDGSDYSGPVTLWAQGPSPVRRQRKKHVRKSATCKNGLHPWTPDNVVRVGNQYRCKACWRATKRKVESKRNPPRPCAKCGTLTALPGGQTMCAPCIDAAARHAAELHAAGGLNWSQVAALVGYGTGEGARYAARRIGYVPTPKPVTDRRPKCPDCGHVAAYRGRLCHACAEAKAWRAVEMRRGGMTLLEIAGRLGFTSKTSVTNLMKTVVPVEPRMGAPRKDASLL